MFNLFKKTASGLSISDYSIEAISLKGPLKNPRLLGMARIILDPGIIKNNIIINKEGLQKSLKKLIQNPKFGKIRTNKLTFSLPESKTFIHIFELPAQLNPQQERRFIISQAQKTFPFLMEELYLDYQIMETNNTKKTKKIILVGAPKNVVDDYLTIFKKLKFQLLSLETESESLGRVLVNTEQPTLVVDIGAKTTVFSLFVAKKLEYSHTYNIAGNQFTKSLTKFLGIPINQAESLKKEAGLNPEAREGKVFFVLQKDIQKIVWEIRKIEKYFQERINKKVQTIILTGGSALLPYLPQYLNQNLQQRVLIGDPWSKINIKQKKFFGSATSPMKNSIKKGPQKNRSTTDKIKDDSVIYASCIGAALRGLTKHPAKKGTNLLIG